MAIPSESERIPLRVYRSIDVLAVAAPMPGVAPEDINVEVTTDGRLLIEGRLCAEPEVECGALGSQKVVLLDEWSPGPYRRELALSDAVDGEAATLTYGNGILVVALPLASAHRPARLTLERIGPSRGERAGDPTHPAHHSPVSPVR